MKILKIISLTFIGAAIILIACNKETAHNTTQQSMHTASVSNAVVSACDQFAYSDTIYYLKPQTKDYIVKPLTALTGKYGCYPLGMQIDSVTGYINVTKSETGLEYIVWFVPAGTIDTCKKFITISGVNYKDSVYVMANNSALSNPVYDANSQIAVDCSGGGCEFDDGPDDDNGNGYADEPPSGSQLIPKGFVINKTTGIINFKKSIQNGVLGKNPVAGTSQEFTLYYRLGDKSSKALNKISFDLFYYKNQSDIPAKLLDELSTKQGQVLEEGDDGDTHGGGDSGHGGGGHGSNLMAVNLATAASGKGGKGITKCRPPYIIVTQQ